MVVHVNSLKKWVDVEAQVLRVVVAQEEEQENHSQPQPKLPNQQERDIQQLLEEFKDVVTTDVGKASGVEHRIDTGDHQPTRSAPHRLASYWKEQLQTEISELLAAGILRTSHSPWSSPMVPVKKPDGSVRLCIDYRKLNSVTSSDPYAIPLIEELLDKVGNATYLTKIDLNKGFYQIKMAEADIDKTAFCSPWGKYAFTHMPFGLRNAPATFQRHMTAILSGLEEFTGVYFDDVIVYSQTWKDHLVHLQETLGRLRKHGLTAKPSKCVWGVAELVYLGHTVGHGKLSVPECRVVTLRKFHQPVTKHDLRAFLGTVGYYRRFIKDFATIALPLTDATKKNAPTKISWDKGMLSAFSYLCNSLSDHSALVIPNQDDNFLLQTDASGRGIAAVLSVCRGNAELPVGYYSKKLSPAETRYTVTEMECLAVVRGMEHLEVYLLGKEFTMQTDHHALQFLQTSCHLNGRLTRWALHLQAFLRYQVSSWD